MSANTSIKEGGTPFPFGPVRAILVEGSDGKYYPWVPESERQLGYKSIDKNGIYRASDDGVYGWGSVSVSVSQATSVTGRDPDTGEEVVVRPDPETGDLVETVVPVEIRVIEPPTNPYGTYVDGQTITKDGLVVKAYSANGDEMQIVPVGEITLEPDKAAYDPDTDTADVTANIDTSPVSQPISTRYVAQVMGNPTYPLVEIEAYRPMAAITNTSVPDNTNAARFHCIIATDQAGAIVGKYTQHMSDDTTRVFEIQASRSYTYDGRTVYYADDSYNSYFTSGSGFIPVAGGYPSSQIPVGAIAWALLYGEYSQRGSPQTINVSWPRTGDGAVLETAFDILVGPHGGQGDD